jgi:DnaJ-class molecular chaperone
VLVFTIAFFTENPAPGAQAAFQKVTDAYETLSDERKKEIYDQLGHETYTTRAKHGGGDAGGSAFRTGGGVNAENLSADDFIRFGVVLFAFNVFKPRVRFLSTECSFNKECNNNVKVAFASNVRERHHPDDPCPQQNKRPNDAASGSLRYRC